MIRQSRRFAACVLASAAFLLPACSAPKAEAPKPPRMMAFEDFMTYDSAPNIYFAGQPSPEALEAFKAAGGTTIINLRTDNELNFVPYYNAKASESFKYTHIACSGSTMGPTEFAAFQAAYEAAGDGPVLIHCASSGRAKAMWGAYEQQALGLSREQVLANAAERGQDSERAQEFMGTMLDRMAAPPADSPDQGEAGA